jgi:hypothetical protein
MRHHDPDNTIIDILRQLSRFTPGDLAKVTIDTHDTRITMTPTGGSLTNIQIKVNNVIVINRQFCSATGPYIIAAFTNATLGLKD